MEGGGGFLDEGGSLAHVEWWEIILVLNIEVIRLALRKGLADLLRC